MFHSKSKSLMKHEMPILPYAQAALAPRMSEETIAYHYGKHLQTYIDNLNRLIAGTLYEDMELEEIVCKASGPVYNNAAQAWNHTFFFESLTPKPVPMSANLAEIFTSVFGSVDAFKQQLLDAAAGLFGSGWVWLTANEKCELAITTGANAACPLTEGRIPLLTIDVWEHAYYIDYRNRRADYLKNLWELIDWAKVEARMKQTSCNVYI